MKPICIIFNPAAKGERAKRLQQHPGLLDAECVLKPTWAPGAARSLAAEAVREGCSIIVAAGGDGTVNEVLNGIGDEPNGFDRVRLGVLPVGTVNVFAKELGMPSDLTHAINIFRAGRERLIDLPKAHFDSVGQTQSRYFVQMAGAGLDARAVELVDWKLKRRFGYFAYVIALLKAFVEKRVSIKVLNGDPSMTGELVVFGNGRFYGGKHNCFPEAKMDDGLLDVIAFPRVDWLIALATILRALTLRVPPHSGALSFRTASVRLESSPNAPVELDGEFAGHLPVTFSVRQKVLRVVVP